MSPLSRVGPALGLLRTLKGVSKGELADRLQIDASVVGRREAEAYNPQFSKLALHLEALDVTIVEFALAMERVNDIEGAQDDLLLALHKLGKGREREP